MSEIVEVYCNVILKRQEVKDDVLIPKYEEAFKDIYILDIVTTSAWRGRCELKNIKW